MKPSTILFVPGIKGSQLANNAKQLRWLGSKQIFNFDRKPLCGDELLFPQGLMERILWQPIYDPFLKFIHKKGTHFFTFPYDWRKEGQELAAQLKIFVQTINENYGSVLLIAHSLGGLISLPVIRQYPEYFHGAVFAGSPFGAGIDFVRDMHQGVRIGLNRHILNSEAHFSWFSPYLFFPENKENSRIIDAEGRPIAHDWFDANAWEQRNLSIFQQKLPEQKLLWARHHLYYALSAAKFFRKWIKGEGIPKKPLPPLAVIAGNNNPTLSQLVCRASGEGYQWDFRSGLRLPGDGRVEFSAAMLPEDLRAHVFSSHYSHGALLNDKYALGKSFEYLNA